MRASDFTSIGAINLLHGGYYQLRKSEWEKFDKDTIKANKAQLKVLSYCSCVITQMFFYLFKTSDLHSLKDRETNKNNGGTLNWAMLTLIIKNVAQVFYYQSKTNNLLLEEQQQLIDVLLKEQETHE